MFVIVHDNFVIHGPRDWNKKQFEEVLSEECEIQFVLETRNYENVPVIISDNIKILPVVGLPQPEYNPKIQYMNGPFWNFTDTTAEMYYTVENLAIDAIKNFFASDVANFRYTRENEGVKHTIQDTEVSVDTSRNSRNVFLHTLLTMNDGDTINWKFPEGWVQLSKDDIKNIISTCKNHVQNCFDWENDWINRVNETTTHDELDNLYNELQLELKSAHKKII